MSILIKFKWNICCRSKTNNIGNFTGKRECDINLGHVKCRVTCVGLFFNELIRVFVYRIPVNSVHVPLRLFVSPVEDF